MSIDPAKSVVAVDLGPVINNSIHQVAPNKLSFLAKGWTWSSGFQPLNPHGNMPMSSPSQTQPVGVQGYLQRRIRRASPLP